MSDTATIPALQTQQPADRCLQCGKSRAQVRDYFDSPCATATYGEVIEGLDDWPKHHWANWSDAELRKFGIPEDWWEVNRRTDWYDMEFPQRSAICRRDGHTPEDWGTIVCASCYEDLTPPTAGSTE